MALCIKAMYDAFPEIKAFGCCHEVFGTQKLMCDALEEIRGVRPAHRSEVKVNVVGVNHFTWITEAKYHDIDVMPVYAEYAEKYKDGIGEKDANWLNKFFSCQQMVKFDLFKRYGAVAAAGDRHLAEFCEGDWYLQNPDHVASWGFGLTPVSWRKETLQARLARSARLRSGEEALKLDNTGEEGVDQMRALLGLSTMVTNVNLPNVGQIPNLPYGAIVEGNAAFRANSLTPVIAGEIPTEIYPLIARASAENEDVLDAAFSGDLNYAYEKFAKLNMLKSLTAAEKKALFDEMCKNTEKYLQNYNK
jgi:alpha-galactosidase